jgi:hypothetical protein
MTIVMATAAAQTAAAKRHAQISLLSPHCQGALASVNPAARSAASCTGSCPDLVVALRRHDLNRNPIAFTHLVGALSIYA